MWRRVRCPSVAALELEALVTRHRQVVRMRVSEQVRRRQALPVVQVRIDRVLALLEPGVAGD